MGLMQGRREEQVGPRFRMREKLLSIGDEEGCAFEELISFHGGLGGPQTQPFILHPHGSPLPDEPIVGAEQVHGVLAGWRQSLQGGAASGTPTSR
jgi:hypothetical protein